MVVHHLISWGYSISSWGVKGFTAGREVIIYLDSVKHAVCIDHKLGSNQTSRQPNNPCGQGVENLIFRKCTTRLFKCSPFIPCPFVLKAPCCPFSFSCRVLCPNKLWSLGACSRGAARDSWCQYSFLRNKGPTYFRRSKNVQAPHSK